jgi:hypothetical protein
MTAADLATALQGRALVSYAEPGRQCHCRLVADYLEQTVRGLRIAEYGYPRELIPAAGELPAKGTPAADLPWEVACEHCKRLTGVPLGELVALCPVCSKQFAVNWTL